MTTETKGTATPNAVPDHENPAWLRAEAAAMYNPPTSLALAAYADIIDVCGRGDVTVLPPNRAMLGTEWTLWHRDNDDGPVVRAPTLHAAVRAFLAAERQDNTPPSPDTIP